MRKDRLSKFGEAEFSDAPKLAGLGIDHIKWGERIGKIKYVIVQEP